MPSSFSGRLEGPCGEHMLRDIRNLIRWTRFFSRPLSRQQHVIIQVQFDR